MASGATPAADVISHRVTEPKCAAGERGRLRGAGQGQSAVRVEYIDSTRLVVE